MSTLNLYVLTNREYSALADMQLLDDNGLYFISDTLQFFKDNVETDVNIHTVTPDSLPAVGQQGILYYVQTAVGVTFKLWDGTEYITVTVADVLHRYTGSQLDDVPMLDDELTDWNPTFLDVKLLAMKLTKFLKRSTIVLIAALIAAYSTADTVVQTAKLNTLHGTDSVVTNIKFSADSALLSKTNCYFNIILDFGNEAGLYTDFELKATTNNFEMTSLPGGGYADSGLAYLYASWYNADLIADVYNNLCGIDIGKDLWYYDSAHSAWAMGAGRQLLYHIDYFLKNDILSYDAGSNTRGGVFSGVIYSPSHEIYKAGRVKINTEWLSEDTHNLRWAYIRKNSAGVIERDAAGHGIWRSITPIWTKHRIDYGNIARLPNVSPDNIYVYIKRNADGYVDSIHTNQHIHSVYSDCTNVWSYIEN